MYNDDMGEISWVDLTVKDTRKMRDFYSAMIGFETEPFAMDGDDGHIMKPPIEHDQQLRVCHARGSNAALPSQWLVDFINRVSQNTPSHLSRHSRRNIRASLSAFGPRRISDG